MREDYLWLYWIFVRWIHRSSIDRVAPRRIASVCPIEHPVGEIKIQVDGLGKILKEQFNIRAICRSLPSWGLDIRAEDAAFTGVIRALLSPIELASVDINGNSRAPVSCVQTFRLRMAGLNQRFNLGTIQIAAHYTHALAIGPIQLAALLIELNLLRCKRASGRNDRCDVSAAEIGADDGAVVRFGVTHVRPIEMSGCDIYGQAVR